MVSLSIFKLMRIKFNTKVMRKFSGITTIHVPEATHSDNMPPVQMRAITEKDESNTKMDGMNIQPNRTEFRNIYK